MFWVKAVHYVPEIKQIIFIVSTNLNFHDLFHLSLVDNKKTKCSDHIDLYRNRMSNIKYQQWTIIIMLEGDFLLSLKQPSKNQGEQTNPSNHNPENMELLTISVSDTPRSSLCRSLNTPKALGKLQKEDIVEVFI